MQWTIKHGTERILSFPQEEPGQKHGRDEWVVAPGTGLDLAAPLRFSYAANLPFSDRGTGILFEPATKFVHISNEAVQALGSGIMLDRPLAKGHAIDARVTTRLSGRPKTEPVVHTRFCFKPGPRCRCISWRQLTDARCSKQLGGDCALSAGRC